MYKIGIIDDVESDASSIMLTILTYTDKVDEDGFNLYRLKKEEGFKEHLFSEILENIEDNLIQCLIVDYKLDMLREVLQGIEIVEYLHDKVPEFPVIILTNVASTSKKNNEADPDKVYDKKIFMNPDNSLSKELVYNIERNIERYVVKRSELELRLEECLPKVINSEDYDDEIYGELIEVEKKLSKFKPMQLTMIDEALKVDEMKEALDMLKEYKGLLE